MQHHQVLVIGSDLIELGPDQLVIVELEPAGERDLRPSGQQHLIVGAFLRSGVVPTVAIAEVTLL